MLPGSFWVTETSEIPNSSGSRIHLCDPRALLWSRGSVRVGAKVTPGFSMWVLAFP